MIKLINLQREAYSGCSGYFGSQKIPTKPANSSDIELGRSIGKKNTETPEDCWVKVKDTFVDEILIENKCLKSSNSITYDTYVPTVHIENLRDAVHDGYLHGYKEGLKENRETNKVMFFVFIAVVLAEFYVFFIQK